MDLTEAPTAPLLLQNHDDINGDSDVESTNGQVYLNNVDTMLQEIREKAEVAVANSVVLQASNSDESLLTRKDLLGTNFLSMPIIQIYFSTHNFNIVPLIILQN